MIKIQILLSAYNGQEFLREQIDSLLQQRNVSVSLLIRDDGSNDETAKILSEYDSLPNVKVIYGQNCGVIQSFFDLLKASDASFDFYAFCDQDDVWMPDKLKRASEILKKENQLEPLLYTSVVEITNEKLRHISFSKIPPKGVSFFNAMIENVSPGNTQVFNNCLRELLCKAVNTHQMAMHDHYAYMVAAAFGQVIFDDKSYIQYRQHAGNEIGMGKGLVKFLNEKASAVISGRIKRISRQLETFLDTYSLDLKQEYVIEAKRFLTAKNFFKRVHYVFHKRTFFQRSFPGFIFWILYIFGLIN